MAKTSKSTTFINALINKEDMTITETTKDDIKVYNLESILNEWNGIDGVSITFKQDDEIPADE